MVLIPSGFAIHSDGSLRGQRHVFQARPEYARALREAIGIFESRLGWIYGDPVRPLFLSISLIRPVLDTVPVRMAPAGLSDQTLPALIQQDSDSRQTYNAYRILVRDYAEVVMERAFRLQRRGRGGIRQRMDQRLAALILEKGYTSEDQLSAEDGAWLAGTYKAMFQVAFGEAFPDDPWEQLEGVISAFLTLPFNQSGLSVDSVLEVSLWVEPLSYLSHALPDRIHYS
jgi:pyruvate, orthophosphate dikinase